VEYKKPHLTFDEQVQKLTDHGLICDDAPGTVQRLRAVGYYRLSAYVYPFRELLPVDQQAGAHYRSDNVRPQVTWTNVVDLWKFDRALRMLCLDAAETIEVGVRTQIAYVLGARDKFGHTRKDALNETRCDAPCRDAASEFEGWMSKYRELVDGAKNEDYVKHHLLTYPQDEVPIWVAVEFFSFGAVNRLLGLMKVEDANEVARAVGVSSGAKLRAFLLTVGYLRNLAAHHSRLWNRTLTVKLPKFYSSEVGPDLAALATGAAVEPKVYGAFAVMAYLVRNIDPCSDWPRKVRERVLSKFPRVPYLASNTDMGFPSNWEAEPLWHDAPRSTGFSFPSRRN
jgi:abortive infection bacteriophage resistance protein